MRISDWSSDVCSSDLIDRDGFVGQARLFQEERDFRRVRRRVKIEADHVTLRSGPVASGRSEEHTSELQSLMRTSYAVFYLKKKKIENKHKQYVTYTHSK